MNTLKDGSPTGLHDCGSRPILVGSFIKKPVECNTEFHGEYAVYKVELRGIVPVLSYVRSEKGKLLPEGYLASPLSDEYDQKLFLFALDVSTLRPVNEIFVMPEEPK